MRRIENVTLVDGQRYKPGDEIWDLGSFVATSAKGRKRNYEGLSKDVDKLPHYVDTGSSAFCLDTGDFYKYLRSTDIWYKMGNMQVSCGGGGVSDYNDLNGKPQINGVTLQGDMTLEDLGINGAIYSYDEHVVGRWVDGKPLYEKTVNFGNLPANGEREIYHEIQNVKSYFINGGFILTAAGSSFMLNSVIGQADFIRFILTPSRIICNTNTNVTGNYSAIVFVRYTKTTD